MRRVRSSCGSSIRTNPIRPRCERAWPAGRWRGGRYAASTPARDARPAHAPTNSTEQGRAMKILGCLTLAFVVALGGCASTPRTPAKQSAGAALHVGHVFIIVLENQPFDTTFGAQSPAPYLAH